MHDDTMKVFRLLKSTSLDSQHATHVACRYPGAHANRTPFISSPGNTLISI
jgi:hypothetical protein